MTQALQREDLERMAQSVRRREQGALDRTNAEIDRLGLTANVAELESSGYTTLRGVLTPATIERALAAILRRAEQHAGRPIDLETASEDDFKGMTYLPYLLYEDEVFEEILLQPAPLALMTYLLGESCVLSSLGSHFKGPGAEGALPLHSDNGNGMVAPFPPYSQVANINYALTPYSREAGALALVPGSHHWARQPSPHEMMLGGSVSNPNAIAMDLNPGDAVIWHGNTWHGSFAREIPGVRVNLAVYMARQYIQTQEQHKGVVPEDVLARHADDDRFAVLLGARQPYGWQKEGPDYALMARNPKGLFD